MKQPEERKPLPDALERFFGLAVDKEVAGPQLLDELHQKLGVSAVLGKNSAGRQVLVVNERRPGVTDAQILQQVADHHPARETNVAERLKAWDKLGKSERERLLMEVLKQLYRVR